MLHELRVLARTVVPRRFRPSATAFVFRGVAFALRGDAVVCPCCGGRFRHFVSYPTRFCPGCGAYERQRQLCLYADRHPGLLAGDVLQVGPEACLIARFRGGARSWLAVDIDNPLADRVMDVQELDLPAHTFDAILCAHVLDVVPDVARAATRLHRVLRPEGVLLLHLPPHADAAAVGPAGFSIEEIVLAEQRDPAARRRLGLDLLPLYVCRPILPATARGM